MSVVGLMCDLVVELGVGMLFILYDLVVVCCIVDCIFVMFGGCVLELGLMDQFWVVLQYFYMQVFLVVILEFDGVGCIFVVLLIDDCIVWVEVLFVVY